MVVHQTPPPLLPLQHPAPITISFFDVAPKVGKKKIVMNCFDLQFSR